MPGNRDLLSVFQAGYRQGKLTITEDYRGPKSGRKVSVRCDCGTEKRINIHQFGGCEKRPGTRSCGTKGCVSWWKRKGT